MGNIYEIRQVEPYSLWGAAIPIREGKEIVVEDILNAAGPSWLYVFIQICTDRLYVPNLFEEEGIIEDAPEGFYLTIQSGGKMSVSIEGTTTTIYDRFRDLMQNLAPYLDDGEFYVADELYFLDTYRLKTGQVNISRLITWGRRPLKTYLRMR